MFIASGYKLQFEERSIGDTPENVTLNVKAKLRDRDTPNIPSIDRKLLVPSQANSNCPSRLRLPQIWVDDQAERRLSKLPLPSVRLRCPEFNFTF